VIKASPDKDLKMNERQGYSKNLGALLIVL